MSRNLNWNPTLEFRTGLEVFVPDWAKSGSLAVKLRLWCLASHRHPEGKNFFYSIAAINRERQRQCQHSQWWIIHPFSALRFWWETLMTPTYALSFVIIPFMICFIVFDYEFLRLDEISPVLYAFFWCDIAVNCMTGIYDKSQKSVILDQRHIFKNYLRSYFIIDMVTSLPYDHITYPWRKLPGPGTSNFVIFLNLLPLLKILRYVTFQSYASQLFTHFGIQDFTHRMITALSLSLYVIYWCACLCYVTPVIVAFIREESIEDCVCWLSKVHDGGISTRFRYALFTVIENFVASGFGGIEPEFSGHIVICTVLMFLGRIFEAYIIILILQIHRDKKAPESEYQEAVNQILAFSRHKQIPAYMMQRLKTYYRYRYQNNFFKEKKILSRLSVKLRDEIFLHSCRGLVENVLLFRDISTDIISTIILSLRMELYLPNDTILRAGSQGDCMFFLGSGTVAVYTPTGKEICHLGAGSYFGEIALLMQDQRRTASIVAIEVCEVYRLDRRDFRRVIANHRELFEKIEEIATKRIEKTLFIEGQQKKSSIRYTRRF